MVREKGLVVRSGILIGEHDGVRNPSGGGNGK
jgi:hypothetical protein